MATPPTFSAGAVLTAAQMNAVGLWEIKNQTIGTAVATVEVTGAFSADYDTYLITISGGVASTQVDIKMTLGSTVTGYYYGLIYNLYGTGTPLGVAANNAASWVYAGAGTTNTLDMYAIVRNPFNTKYTMITSNYTQSTPSAGNGTMQGYLGNTTSYTAFTIAPNTGTVTGGTIRVYGYRN